MEIEDLKRIIRNLSEKGHPEKIKLFGWYLHVQKGVAHFQPSEIGKCYDALDIARPSSFGGYFANLVEQQQLLKNKYGYRLEDGVRDTFDGRYGSREISVQVAQLLLHLPEKIPDLAERTYLDEALICYKHGAFRAAAVITWPTTICALTS